MPKSKYYKLLGLTDRASDQEVRKRFRMLAMKYHPDKNSDPGAEDLFIQLTEAYEYILNKRPLPSERTTAGGRNKSTKTSKEEHEQRIKDARKRFEEQKQRQQEEDQRYFRYLTQGRKWKTIRIGAVIGTLLSALILLDFILPHHYEEDNVTEYQRSVAAGPSGQLVGIIKTEQNRYYWVSNMTQSLYSTSRKIYVETSWIFHNPIQVISIEKTQHHYYDTHFTVYSAAFLIIPFFLVPFFTMRYKRMSVKFTLLYHLSYYGVSIGILLFLLTGHRWAHLLTMGFM